MQKLFFSCFFFSFSFLRSPAASYRLTHCHTLLATLSSDFSQLWLQKVQVVELLQGVQILHLHHLKNNQADKKRLIANTAKQVTSRFTGKPLQETTIAMCSRKSAFNTEYIHYKLQVCCIIISEPDILWSHSSVLDPKVNWGFVQTCSTFQAEMEMVTLRAEYACVNT